MHGAGPDAGGNGLPCTWLLRSPDFNATTKRLPRSTRAVSMRRRLSGAPTISGLAVGAQSLGRHPHAGVERHDDALALTEGGPADTTKAGKVLESRAGIRALHQKARIHELRARAAELLARTRKQRDGFEYEYRDAEYEYDPTAQIAPNRRGNISLTRTPGASQTDVSKVPSGWRAQGSGLRAQ
jgi:hypothetical protein